MGYFSRQATERMDHPLREDHSVLSHTQQLTYYFEDILSFLAERGVSEESLCAADGGQLLDYYKPNARYHYFEVLFAEDPSTEDLIAALGEVALLLQQRSAPTLLSHSEPDIITPFEQLRLIA